MCHLWPSISPWNVWDLPWLYWRAFAAQADDYAEAQKEASRG